MFQSKKHYSLIPMLMFELTFVEHFLFQNGASIPVLNAVTEIISREINWKKIEMCIQLEKNNSKPSDFPSNIL